MKCNHEHSLIVLNFILLFKPKHLILSKQELVSERKTNDENNVLKQQSIMNDFLRYFFQNNYTYIDVLLAMLHPQLLASVKSLRKWIYVYVVETFIAGNGFKN